MTTLQDRLRQCVTVGDYLMARDMLAKAADRIDALEAQVVALTAENENVRRANLDCMDHFNALKADYDEAVKQVAALTPSVAPCATCEHYKRGVNPLIGIYDSDCFECKHYYASKYEQKGTK